MKDERKVSIVVPVYNVAAYLDECLRSIAGQSYANWEALVVNDGSADGSWEICRRWSAADPRFLCFDNSNHGVSYTRNFALARCSGDYVTFVDSDDKVAPNYVAALVALLEQSHADLAVTANAAFREDGALPYTDSDERFIKTDEPETVLFRQTNGMAASKLYRSELLRRYDLRFDETIYYCEDLLFNMRYCSHCAAVAISPAVHYARRLRPESASHAISPKWFTMLRAYEYMFTHFAGKEVFPDLLFYYLKNLYEADYHIRKRGVCPGELGLDIPAEIKRAEACKGVLPRRLKRKLFFCRYFVPAILARRGMGVEK